MDEQRTVQLSFKSWVYVGGLVGLCGGLVLGTLSALWSLLQGQWLGAIAAVLGAPICGLLSFSIYAALGYIVYRRISSAFPGSRVLSGHFEGAVQ